MDINTSCWMAIHSSWWWGGWGWNTTVFIASTAWSSSGLAGFVWLSPWQEMIDNTLRNVYLGWVVPDGWATIVSVKMHWSTIATSWNTNLKFDSQATASWIAMGTWSTSDGIAVTTYATNWAVHWLEIIDITAAMNWLTMTAGYNIGIDIERQGGAAADTIWAMYIVYGVEIIYS